MENEDLLKQLLEIFFQCNPEPSDEQFHDLARSLGMDPPTLEAISYKMNAEAEGANAGLLLGASEAEEVLDGDYDADTTSPDLLMMNDGEPAGTADDGNQDALRSDGVGPEDFGVDVEGEQSALHDDGAPGLKIAAATRLQLTAAAPDQLAMMRAMHLQAKKYTLEQLAQEDSMQSGTIYALKLSVPAGDPKYYFAWSSGLGPGFMKIGDKSRYMGARVTVEGIWKIKGGKVNGRGEGQGSARPVYVFK